MLIHHHIPSSSALCRGTGTIEASIPLALRSLLDFRRVPRASRPSTFTSCRPPRALPPRSAAPTRASVAARSNTLLRVRIGGCASAVVISEVVSAAASTQHGDQSLLEPFAFRRSAHRPITSGSFALCVAARRRLGPATDASERRGLDAQRGSSFGLCQVPEGHQLDRLSVMSRHRPERFQHRPSQPGGIDGLLEPGHVVKAQDPLSREAPERLAFACLPAPSVVRQVRHHAQDTTGVHDHAPDRNEPRRR